MSLPTTGGTRRCTVSQGAAPRPCSRRRSASRPRGIRNCIQRVADAISTEARAKHHDAIRQGRATQTLPGTHLSGRRTSTSSGIPAGAAVRKPTARIPTSPRVWASPSSTACRADDPRYLKIGRDAEALRRSQRPGAGAAQLRRRVGERDLRETYLPGLRGDAPGRPGPLGDVRLQPRQRRGRLRERQAPGPDPAGRMALPGLRGVRLRGHSRHPARPQSRRDLRRRRRPSR